MRLNQGPHIKKLSEHALEDEGPGPSPTVRYETPTATLYATGLPFRWPAKQATCRLLKQEYAGTATVTLTLS